MASSLPGEPIPATAPPGPWPRDAGATRGLWLPAAYALALLLAVAPLLTVTIPTMPDYPDHLARLHILAHAADDPVLRSIYQVHWQAIPNLAMDIVALPLARIMPVAWAGRIFIALSLALWIVGPIAIQQALYGRVGVAPLLAGLFAFNSSLFWGFLNYSFTVGLAYLGLAWWIGSADQPRYRRWPMLTVLATVIYLGHLLAFAAFAVAIAGYELARLLERPAPRLRPLPTDLLATGACFLPALALFLFARPRSPGEGTWVQLSAVGSLWSRFYDALWRYYPQPDRPLLLALVFLAIALLATRSATLHPRMRPVLLLLLLATLLMPERGLGGWGAHLRLPAVLGSLFFASLDTRLPRWRTLAIAAAALAVFGYRSVSLAGTWQAFDRQTAEFRTALGSIERGSHLLLAIDRSDNKAHDELYHHIGELAIIDRSVFVPLLYTIAGQQVVRPVGPLAAHAASTLDEYTPVDASRLDALAAPNPPPAALQQWRYLRQWPCFFDYVATVGPHAGNPSPLHLEEIGQGSFFKLYRVKGRRGCRVGAE